MVLCFDVILAIVVRLILLIHSLLVIWLATSITRTKDYWLLAVADLGLIIEGLVTIIVNKAQEWKWYDYKSFFSLLTFYSLTCLCGHLYVGTACLKQHPVLLKTNDPLI